MATDATTVEDYLAELPGDRAEALETVRQTILANVPDGVVETINWGMIAYEVPLEIFPDTYNGKPLQFAALASKRRHMAVYLTTVYASEAEEQWFREAYEATGKKLDMGKSCVRFTKLENLPVELIGEVMARSTLESFLDAHRAVHG